MLLVLVLLAVQAALVFHARSVVTAAAQDGARAAQREAANDAAGVAAASSILTGSDRLLVAPSIAVQRDDRSVTVTVASEVTSVVPFWEPSVAASSSGPIEGFRSEAER